MKMRDYEQEAILSDPYGLRLLMTYEDLRFSEAAAVMGIEAGEWPTAHYLELRDRAREIVLRDPECFAPELLKELGLFILVTTPPRTRSTGRTDWAQGMAAGEVLGIR